MGEFRFLAPCLCFVVVFVLRCATYGIGFVWRGLCLGYGWGVLRWRDGIFVWKILGVTGRMLIRVSTERVRMSRGSLRALFNRNCGLAPGGSLSRPKRFTYRRGIAVVNTGSRLGTSVLNPIHPSARIRLSLASTHSVNIATPVHRSNSIGKDNTYGVINPYNRISLARNIVTTGHRVRVAPTSTRGCNVSSGRVMSIGMRASNHSLVFNSIITHMDPDCTLTVRVSASRTGTTLTNNGLVNRVVSWFESLLACSLLRGRVHLL